MLVSIEKLQQQFGNNLQLLAGRFSVVHNGKRVYLGHVAAEGSVELTEEGQELVQQAPQEASQAPQADINDELSILE